MLFKVKTFGYFLILFISCSFKPEPRLLVLVFLDTECPICQKSIPKIRQLIGDYRNAVEFELVYPTHTETGERVAAFEKNYQLSVKHRLDPGHQLVRQYQVTTTPEVILLSPKSRVLYKGNIDDQFYKLGAYRATPGKQYLRNAIEATLASRPVTTPYVPAVGCLIN